jgi:trk system potassium uptake protein TrkH
VDAFSEIAAGNLNPNSFHCDADDPVAPWFYIRGLAQGAHFLLCGALGLFGLTFLRFSLQGAVFPMHRHAQLWSLIAFFLGFPMLLAIPLYEVIGTGQFIDAYLDIVSTVTTTGLPIFAPSSLTETLIIWRVSLGWASGFLIWVFAWSVFAPLNLEGLSTWVPVGRQ